MRIKYYVLNPNGNITALVTSKVAPEQYSRISAKIMEKDKSVEQVGYVDFNTNPPYLRMSGGEFCGNGVMSAAVLYYYLQNSDNYVYLNMYGSPAPFKNEILNIGSAFTCKSSFDYINDFCIKSFDFEGQKFSLPYVRMDGISHIILENSFDRNLAKRVIADLCKTLKLSALGFLFIDNKSGSLEPLVYVEKENTLFYENSCGSGSVALCSYLSNGKDFLVSLKQPGGIINAQKSGNNIILTQDIKIVGEFEEEF